MREPHCSFFAFELNHRHQLLSRSAPQDRFDPGGDIQERAEIDARVATKSL
jgi:hypothetical protein